MLPGLRCLAELGRGAMGVVYLAERDGVGDRVAVKMLLPERNNARERARFWREAEAMARLHHPNTIPVYQVNEHGGQPFFVMQFVAGGDLGQRLGDAPQPPRLAAELVETLARAVAHAHQFGVIHRDLKPANVLVDAPVAVEESADEGASTLPAPALDPAGVKVTDFGLVKFLDGSCATSGLTVPDEPMGTPCYMAPEQAAGSRQVGILSDVYGLGAVLYKLLTGRPPFEGGTKQEILDKVRFQPLTPPRRHCPSVPRDLELICVKCLDKEPGRRYASAGQLADELRCYLDGRPLRHTRPVGRLEHFRLWCRRDPYRAAATGLASALVAALAAGPVVYAVQEYRNGRELRGALDTANRHLAERHLDWGLGLLEKGDSAGMLWLVRALEVAPPDADDLRRVVRTNLAGWRSGVCPPAGPPLPHPGEVFAVAYRPDGKAVLTGGEDGAVRVWDAADGRELAVGRGHEGRVPCTVFSPDGKAVLTGGEDGTARVWDAANGRQLHLLAGHGGPVSAVAFLGGGKGFVTIDRSGEVRIWDASGRETGRRRGPGGARYAALSPDGATALTAGQGEPFRLWATAGGPPAAAPLPAKLDGTAAVAFSPDGRTALTGLGNTVRLWDVATGAAAGAPLRHPTVVLAAAFSPDGRTVVTGGRDGAARLWDSATGRPFGTVPRHQGEIRAVAVCPDGTTLLTGGTDLTARLWNATPRDALRSVLAHEGIVMAVAYSPDGRTVATGCGKKRKAGGRREGEVRLWDASGAARGVPLAHPGWVQAVAFSPDGKHLLTACWDGVGRLWDVEGGAKRYEFPGHPDSVGLVALSPDGGTAATADHRGTVRLWDVATGNSVGVPLPHPGCVTALAFGPDGRRLLTAGCDGTARLWDAATGRSLGVRLTHGAAVRVAGFTADGAGVFTGGADGVVVLWNASSGEARYRAAAHQGAVCAAGLSPDGRLLLTGGADGAARVWDAATGASLGPDLTHRGSVLSVAFGPDGRTALTGGVDGTARLWDVATCKPLGPPLTHDGPVPTIAFRPDGRGVLTGSNDGTARLWEVPGPLAADVGRARLWAEVLTGKELDARGALHELDRREWNERRGRLEESGGPPG